ncbi:Predicted oxidoreductase [Salinimicrobium catena]|uniref:Predicted oxidoreductase n=1 Tax=Salinimicrobium catena TaxID=390640 RepID=A0A1H5J270_9FLAO|nr:aldo/keto reductase [Salinimicrobium catena]SDK82903.1 Predicted oxidoreductase [Salinimicrobium catena]SEE46161.1 Predicted oxidoreductase [Salinimicrobium catena]
MRQKNSYSRIIQDITGWEKSTWGDKIRFFQHSVEKDITSFLAIGPQREILQDNSLGTALSESGLSRDEIQLIGGMNAVPKDPDELIAKVEETLNHLKTDYLDLFFLDLRTPAEIVMPAVERLFSQGKIVEMGVFDLHDPSTTVPLEKNSVKASLTSWNFTSASMKTLTLKQPGTADMTEMVWINLQETEKYDRLLEPLVQKYQHNAREIFLSWFLQHPAHFHPVLQVNSIEQINSAAKGQHLKLIEEDWKNLPKKIDSKTAF